MSLKNPWRSFGHRYNAPFWQQLATVDNERGGVGMLDDGSMNFCFLLAISFSNDEESKKLAENLGADISLDKMALGDTLITTIQQLCR
jgi:hypothetical protein